MTLVQRSNLEKKYGAVKRQVNYQGEFPYVEKADFT